MVFNHTCFARAFGIQPRNLVSKSLLTNVCSTKFQRSYKTSSWLSIYQPPVLALPKNNLFSQLPPLLPLFLSTPLPLQMQLHLHLQIRRIHRNLRTLLTIVPVFHAHALLDIQVAVGAAGAPDELGVKQGGGEDVFVVVRGGEVEFEGG